MSKKMPIFYSAMMLTGVNLLLRFVGTSFQVYLSGKIGAEGIGLLQLVLSVSSLAMVAGMGGIRTATMYLTAEELGKHRPQNITRVLTSCVRYSILFSGTVCLLVFACAPLIASKWIGNDNAEKALRLMAVFLPVNCLCGVMTGYFTGANRIGTLAAIEVIEQILSLCTTMTLLNFYAGHDAEKACPCVILGSGVGACLTLLCLVVLRILEKACYGPRQPIVKRLLETAIPLAVADDLRTGITTAENLIVPRRLALYSGIVSPLAAFGIICGMVFPILMFPAAILFGLTELLIPELARCNAADNRRRIYYLISKSLRVAMIYGVLCGGILYLAADDLCHALYKNEEAGIFLRWFSPLAVMLYCDIITDSAIKGLGCQKISVWINILTNTMDILLLFFFLPIWGIKGYFYSFFITHAINFILSICLLVRITGYRLHFKKLLLTALSFAASLILCSSIPRVWIRCCAFVSILITLLYLLGILNVSDLLWLKGLIIHKKCARLNRTGTSSI